MVYSYIICISVFAYSIASIPFRWLSQTIAWCSQFHSFFRVDTTLTRARAWAIVKNTMFRSRPLRPTEGSLHRHAEHMYMKNAMQTELITTQNRVLWVPVYGKYVSECVGMCFIGAWILSKECIYWQDCHNSFVYIIGYCSDSIGFDSFVKKNGSTMVTGSIYTLKILCLFRIYVYIVTAPLMLLIVYVYYLVWLVYLVIIVVPIKFLYDLVVGCCGCCCVCVGCGQRKAYELCLLLWGCWGRGRWSNWTRTRERVNRKSDGNTAKRNKSRARKQRLYQHWSGGVVKTHGEILRFITA